MILIISTALAFVGGTLIGYVVMKDKKGEIEGTIK